MSFISRGVVFSLALVGLIQGCSSTPSKTEDSAAAGAPIEGGVTILYQAGREGTWEPCGCQSTPFGGLDRELNAVNELRKATPDLLYVDAGNLFAPATGKVATATLKAKAPGLVAILNDLGLQAYSPGPGDFALGLDFLKKREGEAKFKFINSNVVDAKGLDVFTPFQVFDVAGKKVAVLGIVPTSVKPGPGLSVVDPKTALEKHLKNVQADIVVVLSQLGKHEADRALATSVPRVNVVIGNDQRMTLHRGEPSGTQLLLDGHQYGFFLGKVVIEPKTPIKGFYSDEVLKERAGVIEGYQKALANADDAARKATLQKKIEGMLKLYPLEAPEGASRFSNELIALSVEKYGTPNAVTEKIAAEKERTRKAALDGKKN